MVTKVSQSERARRFATAAVGYTTAAMAVGEMVSRVATDMNAFLVAEPDAPIPPSLRQAVRMLNTPELEECAARVTSGVTRGVTQAAAGAMGPTGDTEPGEGADGPVHDAPSCSSTAEGQSMVDKILERVLDARNWGLVSCIVSSTTRQTLEAVIDVVKEQMEARQSGEESGGRGNATGAAGVESPLSEMLFSWLDKQPERVLALAASPEGKGVLLDLCSCFVSNAVGVYLEKTAGTNTFDDFFSAASRARNRDVMQDIAGRCTGEAVRTVVEVVSPGMMSPGVKRAAERRAARDAAAREDRGGSVGLQTPGQVPAMVVGRSRDGDGREWSRGEYNSAEGSCREGPNESPVEAVASLVHDEELMMTPRPAGASRLVVSSGDSMSDDSMFAPYGAGHHVINSTSSPSSDDTSDTIVTASQTAAAAFTTAVMKDLAPHLFRVMVAPEGRQLITEVAGTCTASAVRSFVLSMRDCVFFVQGSKGGAPVVLSVKNATRVALFAVFVFFLFRLLCMGVISLFGYSFSISGYIPKMVGV